MASNGDENVRSTEDGEGQSPSFNEYQNELLGTENYHNVSAGNKFIKPYRAGGDQKVDAQHFE